METSEVSLLQKAANYYTYQRSVSKKGTHCIIFGIIAILFGLLLIGASMLNITLIVLGVLSVVTGVWAKVNTNLAVLLISAIFLALVTLWYFGLLVYFASTNSFYLVVFGTIIIIIANAFQGNSAVDAFIRFRYISSMTLEKPQDEIRQKVESLGESVSQGNITNNSQIELQLNPGKFQGRLTDDYIVLVNKGRDYVLLASPADVDIVSRGRFRKTNLQKTTCKIAGMTYKGTIDETSLQRVQTWKEKTGRPVT